MKIGYAELVGDFLPTGFSPSPDNRVDLHSLSQQCVDCRDRVFAQFFGDLKNRATSPFSMAKLKPSFNWTAI